jgi:hypothetical protein
MKTVVSVTGSNVSCPVTFARRQKMLERGMVMICSTHRAMLVMDEEVSDWVLFISTRRFWEAIEEYKDLMFLEAVCPMCQKGGVK